MPNLNEFMSSDKVWKVLETSGSIPALAEARLRAKMESENADVIEGSFHQCFKADYLTFDWLTEEEGVTKYVIYGIAR